MKNCLLLFVLLSVFGCDAQSFEISGMGGVSINKNDPSINPVNKKTRPLPVYGASVDFIKVAPFDFGIHFIKTSTDVSINIVGIHADVNFGKQKTFASIGIGLSENFNGSYSAFGFSCTVDNSISESIRLRLSHRFSKNFLIFIATYPTISKSTVHFNRLLDTSPYNVYLVPALVGASIRF